jgi:hypothetical protein
MTFLFAQEIRKPSQTAVHRLDIDAGTPEAERRDSPAAPSRG